VLNRPSVLISSIGLFNREVNFIIWKPTALKSIWFGSVCHSWVLWFLGRKWDSDDTRQKAESEKVRAWPRSGQHSFGCFCFHFDNLRHVHGKDFFNIYRLNKSNWYGYITAVTYFSELWLKLFIYHQRIKDFRMNHQDKLLLLYFWNKM